MRDRGVGAPGHRAACWSLRVVQKQLRAAHGAAQHLLSISLGEEQHLGVANYLTALAFPLYRIVRSCKKLSRKTRGGKAARGNPQPRGATGRLQLMRLAWNPGLVCEGGHTSALHPVCRVRSFLYPLSPPHLVVWRRQKSPSRRG